MAALMSPSVTSASSQLPKPSIISSTASEVTTSLSGLTGISPSHLLANIQSGLSFRPQLDLTRFNPTGLPSPSSLLFPYLMNSGTRSFQHQWATQKGLPNLPCQKGKVIFSKCAKYKSFVIWLLKLQDCTSSIVNNQDLSLSYTYFRIEYLPT